MGTIQGDELSNQAHNVAVGGKMARNGWLSV